MGENIIYKIGGIGVGHVFNSTHAPSIAAILPSYGAKLVGFYDIDLKAAEISRERYAKILRDYIEGRLVPREPLPLTTTQEEIIEMYKTNLEELKVYNDPLKLFEDVDIVSVCTPHKEHVDYAVMALEHDVSVVTEKPMGRTWWEARKIVEVAKKSKGIYQLNDNNAGFHPGLRAFKDAMDSGYIGEIDSITIYRGHGGSVSQPFYQRSWYRTPEYSGGGAMQDYGSHTVSATYFLAGWDKKPLEVKSMGIRAGRLKNLHVDDDVNTKILYEDPKTKNWITAYLQATWYQSIECPYGSGQPLLCYKKIVGHEGELNQYRDAEGYASVKVTRRGFGEKVIKLPFREEREALTNAEQNEYINLVNCLRDGKRSSVNEEVGKTIMAIMGAAYLSELKGRTAVTLEEFEEFCGDIAKKCEKEEEVPLAIIRKLMKPYQ